MKQLLFTMLITLSLVTAYAKYKGPKIELKDDVILVDGNALLKIERVKIPYSGGYDNYFIKDLEGNKIAIAKSEYALGYYEINFLKNELKAEISIIYHKPVQIAKYFLDYGLIKDGKITDETIKEFVLITGTKYSDNNANKRIIINNK